MMFTSLTRRLLAWSVLVGLLPLVLLGYLTLRYNERALRDTTLQNLSRLADKKALQIREHVAERIADTRQVARSKVTQEAITRLSRSFQPARPDAPGYRQADARYRAYFERYIDDAAMFYDVFLIDLRGDIVYSQKHESDFATNLLAGPYRGSGLARAFREARMTMESVASDFEYYQPSKIMAAFVAIPVMREGQLLGVIAFQLDITQINRVAGDPIGMGETGETVLGKWVDQQNVMVITPLKDKFEGTQHPIELSEMPNPMRRALSGIRGSGIETDYRNQQVVAAWRYLPDMRLGMVVKMDADEAFASLHQQRVFSLTALLLVMLFASAAAFYFGRKLVVPLQELASGAEDVAQGNLARRVNEQGADEIGLLGRAFNRMAENLQSLYRSLEERVEQRTAELTQSMAELRIKDAAIASSINAIGITDVGGKLSYVNKAFVDLWRMPGPEDAIGRLPTEFIDKPEDAQAVIAALQQQGYWRGELRARLHDGTLADMEMSGHMVRDAAGKPLCMMASFVDVTERNRSQSELRRNQDLLNEAQRLGQLGSWELNLISGELRWSDEVYRIFELDPKLFAPSYKNFLNAIHPDDRDTVSRAYTQSLAARQAYDIEHRLRMADGRIKWVHEHCSSDFDAAGKPVRSVGAVQDITRQKLNEDQLRIAAIAFETHEAIMITGP
ncbi:MAG TPA: PAS domain-containing protein, partial [Gallionella sp.]|nr:PAS domain-containing protein [Gallionella sp.]